MGEKLVVSIYGKNDPKKRIMYATTKIGDNDELTDSVEGRRIILEQFWAMGYYVVDYVKS